MKRSMFAVMAAAALLSACGGTEAPAADRSGMLSCSDLIEAYAVAAQEARRCNPDVADPCGGRALESLESQCLIGVSPGQVAPLESFVEQFRQRGCVFGPPAPCPQRSVWRCEQDVNRYACNGYAP